MAFVAKYYPIWGKKEFWLRRSTTKNFLMFAVVQNGGGTHLVARSTDCGKTKAVIEELKFLAKSRSLILCSSKIQISNAAEMNVANQK